MSPHPLRRDSTGWEKSLSRVNVKNKISSLHFTPNLLDHWHFHLNSYNSFFNFFSDHSVLSNGGNECSHIEKKCDCLAEHFVPKREQRRVGLGKINGMHKRVELAAHWRGQWWMHNCTPHTAHLKLHTSYCTLHTAHFPLHTAHFTLHIIHCAQHIL